MFVSVALDPGGLDTAKSLATLLARYGFHKIQRALWEHTELAHATLAQLKRDIDRVTNYYDTVRLYQYPIKGMFAITEMKQKRWRKCVLKADLSETNVTQ